MRSLADAVLEDIAAAPAAEAEEDSAEELRAGGCAEGAEMGTAAASIYAPGLWAHLTASAATLCVARPVACDGFLFPPRARSVRRFSARRAPRGAWRFSARRAPRGVRRFSARRAPRGARRPSAPSVRASPPGGASTGDGDQPVVPRRPSWPARAALAPSAARTGCARPARGPYGLRQARARLGPPARGSSGCARPVGGPFLSVPELFAVPRASDGAPPLLLPVLLN
ncbi:unnamed protein product [Closterium sp. Naga37s-1]|nr:unnamed protein product [Closterium sp. Naga37s-1]